MISRIVIGKRNQERLYNNLLWWRKGSIKELVNRTMLVLLFHLEVIVFRYVFLGMFVTM